jgi:TetR/AcrR family transcriptional regulator
MMSETDPNRRQEIIAAARRVFARHGFHKASIKQIAKEANLKSAALIYWYFANKEELLDAVIGDTSPALAQLSEQAEAMMAIDPETLLPMIANLHLSTFDEAENRQLFRLIISEIGQNEIVSQRIAQAAEPVLAFLQQYLARQIELGRLRPHDTQVAARTFMGIIMVYVMHRELLPTLGPPLPEPGYYVSEALAIFLEGLQAKEDDGGRKTEDG